MKNRKMFVLAVIVLTMALLACGIGGGGGQPSGGGQATPVSGGQEGGQAAATTAEEGATPAAGSAEQELTLSNVTEGLAALQSYKSVYTLKFAGKDDQGQPVEGSLETREEFTQEPRAQRIAITSTGFSNEQAGQNGTFEMITIGDTSYMVTQDTEGKQQCISMSSSEGTQPEQGFFSPDMLGGVSGAKYVGRETVNGVNTKHYAWTEGGLAALGFTSGKGDVWVAEDGNYTVKYTAEATGKGMLFGSAEEEGTITVEYNLTEVNGSFQIEPPDSCTAPATDIPIMADAQDKAMIGEMVSYSSASALADVVAFYQAEMPNNGWQSSGEPTQTEEYASLEFTKDNRKAQVMITYDTDKQLTSVIITTSTE
jgi:hypothetical protein